MIYMYQFLMQQIPDLFLIKCRKLSIISTKYAGLNGCQENNIKPAMN